MGETKHSAVAFRAVIAGIADDIANWPPAPAVSLSDGEQANLTSRKRRAEVDRAEASS